MSSPGRGRSRSTNPDQWFKGHGHHSFPSGEVALASAAVTPFVLEYGKDHPAVYALEALPVYDAIIADEGSGPLAERRDRRVCPRRPAGYYASRRDTPFILGVLPHQVMVGSKKRF
jgi:undecaprenyl-diphosphatase